MQTRRKVADQICAELERRHNEMLISQEQELEFHSCSGG